MTDPIYWPQAIETNEYINEKEEVTVKVKGLCEGKMDKIVFTYRDGYWFIESKSYQSIIISKLNKFMAEELPKFITNNDKEQLHKGKLTYLEEKGLSLNTANTITASNNNYTNCIYLDKKTNKCLNIDRNSQIKLKFWRRNKCDNLIFPCKFIKNYPTYSSDETLIKPINIVKEKPYYYKRICIKCKKPIIKHHKYIFTDNGPQHRNCNNPKSYV